jgi:uncharacterized protein (DUF952 family)
LPADLPNPDLIYKIVAETLWREAREKGVFHGAAIDLADGYIHFSGAGQVEQTARLHFAGQAGLLLVAVDPARLGPSLKWERSRGGEDFPHLYGTLPADAVLSESALPLRADGSHDFTGLLP